MTFDELDRSELSEPEKHGWTILEKHSGYPPIDCVVYKDGLYVKFHEVREEGAIYDIEQVYPVEVTKFIYLTSTELYDFQMNNRATRENS